MENTGRAPRVDLTAATGSSSRRCGPRWKPGRTAFHGELVTAATPAGLSVALPGAERPVPMRVAAMGPQALAVIGELADGILPNLAGPRVLAKRIVPTVLHAARRAGRPDPRVVAFVPAVVTDAPDHVHAAAAARMGFMTPSPPTRGWSPRKAPRSSP